MYQDKQTKLIVDGGVENNNNDIEQFLDDVQGSIQKLIAQKDIVFSNSMVESVNKTLKYRHLFQQDIPDFKSTVKHLEKAVQKYNNRPHSSLNGLTPSEVLKNIELDKNTIKKGFLNTYKRKIKDNRKVVEIERPVTRPPSHRSRRAELPHRAPQKDSLPHSALDFRNHGIVCYSLQ